MKVKHIILGVLYMGLVYLSFFFINEDSSDLAKNITLWSISIFIVLSGIGGMHILTYLNDNLEFSKIKDVFNYKIKLRKKTEEVNKVPIPQVSLYSKMLARSNTITPGRYINQTEFSVKQKEWLIKVYPDLDDHSRWKSLIRQWLTQTYYGEFDRAEIIELKRYIKSTRDVRIKSKN